MKAKLPTILLPRVLPLVLPLLLAACAGNDVAPREVPPPQVTSVAQADQQLAGVARERAAIEARFAERQQVCYDKFFVNNCLDEARERHRSALAAQRAIEVQAERFKRQTVADERDRQVAESEQHFREQEAKLAAEPPKPAPQVSPVPPPRSGPANRAAQRDARARADAKQEAQEAGKRAQNVADYEKRKADSEERQRRIAQRKAERAAEAAKKAPAAPPAN